MRDKVKADRSMQMSDVTQKSVARSATEYGTPRMSVAFRAPDGSVIHKLFFHQPLGLDFEKHTEPIVIRHVFQNSYASAVSIQEGWVIIGVEGRNVVGMCYDDIWELMVVASTRLPWGNRAVISLEASDGRVDEQVFFHRPLSITVLGEGLSDLSFVMQGMRVMSVNGDSLSDLNFIDAWNRLKAAEERLDHVAKMEIVFVLPNGSYREITFFQRPLGCEVGPRVPLCVRAVEQGTRAASMGVQPGWTIRTVNGEDLTDRDFKYSMLRIWEAEVLLQEAKGTLGYFTAGPITKGSEGTVTTEDPGVVAKDHMQPCFNALSSDTSRPSTTPPSACGSSVPKMILGFKSKSGDLKHKTFFHQPLGFDFEKQMPIIVRDVFKNGYAKALGVEEGWEIVDVNWKVLRPMAYEAAWQFLCDASLPLPHGNCVVMSFLTTRGARQEKTFFHGPLGVEFQGEQLPLTVAEVAPGSHSQSVGVQPNWQVISLNGQSITGIDFQEALQLVLAAENTLDEVAKMDLDFTLPDGSHRELTFHTRPLGCEIETTAPLRVKRVSHDTSIARAGVQAGWIIRAINGEDITGKDFGPIFDMIHRAESILPWQVDREAEHTMVATLQPDTPHKAQAPLWGDLQHPPEAWPRYAQLPPPARPMHAEQAAEAAQAVKAASSTADESESTWIQASDPYVDVGNGLGQRLMSFLKRPVGSTLDTFKMSRFTTARTGGTLRPLSTVDGILPSSARRVATE